MPQRFFPAWCSQRPVQEPCVRSGRSGRKPLRCMCTARKARSEAAIAFPVIGTTSHVSTQPALLTPRSETRKLDWRWLGTNRAAARSQCGGRRRTGAEHVARRRYQALPRTSRRSPEGHSPPPMRPRVPRSVKALWLGWPCHLSAKQPPQLGRLAPFILVVCLRIPFLQRRVRLLRAAVIGRFSPMAVLRPFSGPSFSARSTTICTR